MDAANHTRVYNILIGSMKTQAVHVAAELGLADVLAKGQKDIASLASEVRANPAALRRLLRALCSLGLFSERDGVYSLTPMGHVLRRDVPGSLRPLALLLGAPSWWRAWGALGHTVRSGEGAFNATHGSGYFEYCADHPEELRRFHDFMASIAETNAAAIVGSYPFSDFRRIVDVGGGEGKTLSAILSRYSGPRGVLFDLPGTVPERGSLNPAVAERIDIVGGNFFERVPEGGDAYVLQQVLHDWDDDRAIEILRRCHAAMKPDGKLVVIDAVIQPGNQPDFNKFTDLLMMVLSAGGRERTALEFEALFAKAGFELLRVIPTFTAFSIIEGRRAGGP